MNVEVMGKKRDLEERLIAFAVLIIEIVESFPKTLTGRHFAGQLLRSGTSPALNYGEVQYGESKKDFLHKIKIFLKELRETLVCLKIINRAKIHKSKFFILTSVLEVQIYDLPKTIPRNNVIWQPGQSAAL
jgi:four helix bundle protein